MRATPKQIRGMRALYEHADWTCPEIAHLFRIPEATVYRVVRGETFVGLTNGINVSRRTRDSAVKMARIEALMRQHKTNTQIARELGVTRQAVGQFIKYHGLRRP